MISAIQHSQPAIFSAIENASSHTGVNFDYLLNQAKAESSLNPTAKASTSSATGLFQFIESTWLDIADKHGHKYGLEGLSKQDLLAKRNDPATASFMAAELASENKSIIEARTGVNAGATELYLGHFLGAGSASKFVSTLHQNPDTPAKDLFPAAANANKNVFYNKDGSGKSVADVYAFFDKKFNESPSIAHIPTPIFDLADIPVVEIEDTFLKDVQEMILSHSFYDLSAIAAPTPDAWANNQIMRNSLDLILLQTI